MRPCCVCDPDLAPVAASQAFQDAAAEVLKECPQGYAAAVSRVPARLSACPAVVYRTLALLRRDNVGFNEMEKMVECDPVLTASLLSHANSSLFAHSAPLRSVAAAIAYIGIDTAKRVILAASARPLFASVTLPHLWEHSVDVAAIAEQIAAAGRTADPAEAFTAGLLHDMGRITMKLSDDSQFVAAHARLSSFEGCCVAADRILTGKDHGEIGAGVLAEWRLPRELADAVRLHHQPEASEAPLASVIYLGEVVADSREDSIESARFERALARAGVKTLDWFTSDLRRMGAALAMVG